MGVLQILGDMLDKYRLLRFMLFIPAERRRPCQNLRPKGATFPTTPIVPTTPITPIQRGVLQIHGDMLDKYRLLRFMLFIPAERRRPCQNLRPKGATFPTTPIVPTTPITPIQRGVLQIHGDMLDKYRLLRFMLFIPAERRRPCQNLRPKGATFPTTPIVPITPIQKFISLRASFPFPILPMPLWNVKQESLRNPSYILQVIWIGNNFLSRL